MKDERNHQDTVDKSFLEQQIRIVDTNYILCEKKLDPYMEQNWVLRQAYEIQVNSEICKNHYTSKGSTFCFV